MMNTPIGIIIIAKTKLAKVGDTTANFVHKTNAV